METEKLVLYNSKDFGLLFSPLIFAVRVYNVNYYGTDILCNGGSRCTHIIIIFVEKKKRHGARHVCMPTCHFQLDDKHIQATAVGSTKQHPVHGSHAGQGQLNHQAQAEDGDTRRSRQLPMPPASARTDYLLISTSSRRPERHKTPSRVPPLSLPSRSHTTLPVPRA